MCLYMCIHVGMWRHAVMNNCSCLYTERTNQSIMDCFTAQNTATATTMLVWPNLVLSNASFYVLFSAKAQFCIHCSQSPNQCGVFLFGFTQSAIIFSLSGDRLPKIWDQASRLAWGFESKNLCYWHWGKPCFNSCCTAHACADSWPHCSPSFFFSRMEMHCA